MIDKIRELLFRIFRKDSFIGKLIDKFFTREIVSYIFFGVLTTAVNLIAFYIFKKLFIAIGWTGILNTLLSSAGWEKALAFLSDGSDYLDANTIAWVIGVIFAFFTNKLFVFESKSWSPSVAGKELLGFVGARILSFFAESFLMFVLVTVLSQNEILAKILVGIVVIVMNYVFSKLFIFKKKNTEDAKGE
ncbi:MAG: GtrA family protein [Clostridia bacterium]|nr:GtrA family protein [Clostridia bacterium]